MEKDEDSIYDTLNEVGNISRDVDDFATIDSSMKDAIRNGEQVDGPNGVLRDPLSQTGDVHDEEEAVITHASDHLTHHDPLEAAADKHASRQSRRRRRGSKSCSSGHHTPVNKPTQNGKDQEQRIASCKATANPSTKDTVRDGQQVDSPNGLSQDPSSQTGDVHDEEDAMITHASDKFTHHDPLEAAADKHGRGQSRRRLRSKSHSSGHYTPVNNPTQNGKDQEQRIASCKARANPSTKNTVRNGQQVDSPNGLSQDLSTQTGDVNDGKEAMIAHASDQFTHHDPLEADADKHGSRQSHRHRRRSKSHFSGHHIAVNNPTQNGKDQGQRIASYKTTANPSTKDTVGDGQQVDSPNGISHDLSSQTGDVHDEEEAMIAHASDQLTHHDPLGADTDKHGSGQSRRHRRQSKSHSSGHHSPVNKPTQNGKDQGQRRASCKATASPSNKDALANGREVGGSNDISRDQLLQKRNVHDEEEAIVPQASDTVTHHNPLGACAYERGSEQSRRRRHRSKSHSLGSCTPVSNPTRNCKDKQPRRTSHKASTNTSRNVADAAGNGLRVDGPNGISLDPSYQTGNVHNDVEAIPQHGNDEFTHRGRLGVPSDDHGSENSRKHRRSNSYSSGRGGPVSNPTRGGKSQDGKKNSDKALDITAETLLANCLKELQEKMTGITEQHTKRIDGVSGLLGRLRVSKHIRLEAFERIQSEREALRQKKDELQLQKDEFQRFKSQITSGPLGKSCPPLSRVKNTIKELRTAVGRECYRLEVALPMYGRKTTIIDTVKENQVCVVLGETGSGKSTQMTQYLYEAGFAKKGLIVCTQPRKLAATSLATHVAAEMGGVIGQVVGCHVGGNVQASKATGIIYATDHILLNECLRDPNLSKYSCIIIDEAHERSLYSDLLLGMIKKSLTQRPELRVVITSATIDPAIFVAYFDNCPVLKVSGRMFPVDIIWRDGPTSNTENYLQEAVNAAQEIHRKEGSGDILVFLTSPVETERACEKLGKIEPDSNLVCLALHGKLRQEEQRRVFEEALGKRKVIFATNCAETSITIPGIRYVVDTGMVKEMTFDPKRNKRSLEVTTIHKSSAEQRKGRAGRTQAGKCYRLYSEEEYAAMEDGSRPEILRVHLGQAMLKLMELGIENVTEFEFVESPPVESIKLALQDLELLGATANGQLTDLGHKIARVPLEPRIAKLLFDGIDQGVGAEALALAAIATVSGSVFFRMGSEEEKHMADSRKVGFCHNGGDLLTLLEVYRQHLKQPKGKRNKWAFDNSLNAKSLRLADETIKELKLALKHELNIRVPDAIQQNESTDLKLQKILVSCYAANLCVFTGHQKAGYRVVAFNHSAQLHPSSALKFLGQPPKFIVFEQLLKTSRDFVINATPVEKEWLQEMISEGTVKYDFEELVATVLTEASLPCSRDLMSLAFGGFRRRVIDQVEEKVSKSCDGSLVVLEKNEELGQVKIFVPLVHIVKALSVVGRHLEENRKLLRDEQKEEYLKEDCQSSRIVWGQGGEVQELLMPHMYRTVTVGEIQDGNALVVLDFLKSFGDLVKHSFKEQNGKMRLFATFKHSEDAVMAVKGSSSNCMDQNVKPAQPMSDNTHAQLPQFKVKAKWLRRLGKGTGFIECSSDEDFFKSFNSLRFKPLMIKSSLLEFRVDKHRELALFMIGLHPKTSVEEVTSAIEERLPTVKMKNVFIHRMPEFHTSDETLASQTFSLQESIHTFATEGQFSVYLKRPSPKDFDGHAYLTFQDAEEADAVMRGLSGELIDGIGIVTLQPILSTFLLCSKNVFAVIEDELHAVVKELDMTFDKRLAMKVNNQRKDQRVSIEIQSDCTEHFIRATTVFNEILNGDRIDCKTSKPLEILMTNHVRDVLQSIQKDTGTVINQDWKNRVVRIHGNEASRESAKRAIFKFLDDAIASNSHLWEIQLRGPGRPRGLLKALFERFGVDLKGLQDIPGVQNIHVEFRKHVVKIQSSDEAREAIFCHVEECCKTLPEGSSLLPFDDESQMTCGICLCDVGDTTDLYRLACCGHSYDKSCVIQQLKSAEFPLKCATEGCEELFVWRDLQNLLSEKERKKLAISALDEYVKKNCDILKYCPTADCGSVYRVSTEGRRFTCYACQTEICTSCEVQWHSGLTCAMFKSGKQVEGRLDEWMKQDPSNRKDCPKCKTPIEKIEGCNHMTCSGCKSHMCWLCLEVFPNAEQICSSRSLSESLRV